VDDYKKRGGIWEKGPREKKGGKKNVDVTKVTGGKGASQFMRVGKRRRASPRFVNLERSKERVPGETNPQPRGRGCGSAGPLQRTKR